MLSHLISPLSSGVKDVGEFVKFHVRFHCSSLCRRDFSVHTNFVNPRKNAAHFCRRLQSSKYCAGANLQRQKKFYRRFFGVAFGVAFGVVVRGRPRFDGSNVSTKAAKAEPGMRYWRPIFLKAIRFAASICRMRPGVSPTAFATVATETNSVSWSVLIVDIRAMHLYYR